MLLESVDIQFLSYKTALFFSLGRMSDIHALSVLHSSTQFAPGDRKVTLLPDDAYAAKGELAYSTRGDGCILGLVQGGVFCYVKGILPYLSTLLPLGRSGPIGGFLRPLYWIGMGANVLFSLRGVGS